MAIVSVALVALATPASARSPHRGRHVHAAAHGHHRHHHFAHARHLGRSRLAREQAAPSSPWDNPAVAGPAPGGFNGFSDVVSEARRYIGGNPTGRSRLWCARFMNMVLERSGHHGTGSDLASSFARYGQRVDGPQVGAIAVMSRRGGGHVGVVSGVDSRGNPVVVSGNHGHRVAESVYPRGRIYAYVMPAS